MRDPNADVFTIGIGGAAGDGVREAGVSLGALLTDLGYEVYLSFNYPSLIRGGHNFSRLSFSKEKVWCDHSKLDVLIALNEETIKLHLSELNMGSVDFGIPQTSEVCGIPKSTDKSFNSSVVFADKFEDEDIKNLGENAVVVPMKDTVKEIGAPEIARTSVALGALCYFLDLPLDLIRKILKDVFKNKSMEANIKLAEIGYEHLKKQNFRHSKRQMGTICSPDSADGAHLSSRLSAFLDGNTAFGKGLQSAGLDFYVAYPMTPATSLLHFLAKEAGEKNSKLKVIQPESELSVINMALGMSYAGKRVAIGSATGGFALMQEAFSFAGIAELPLTILVSQRQAPATGVPTYSSQTDLRFAIHAGHGEFPRIVIAPGDTEEAFQSGADSLNLAWKYQIPVISLMDKIISEHSATAFLDTEKIKIEKGKVAEKPDENYGRYEITPDGISPMAFPGTPNTVVKVTSYEHDPRGITADEALPVKDMIEKRFAKQKTILDDLKNYETVKIYGDPNSENAIVFWGSTKGPVLEATKYLDKPVKLVQILWAEPFPAEKVSDALSECKKIINIECNHDGQMGALIKEKTGISVTDMILRYDSRPFEPVELAEQISKML